MNTLSVTLIGFISLYLFICVESRMVRGLLRYHHVSSKSSKSCESTLEKNHLVLLSERKENPNITIWDSDYRHKSNMNNYDFCKNLNSRWFDKIYYRGTMLDLSNEDLQNIKELYMKYVYTPENFKITWRDPDTWKDKNGISLELVDFSEMDIKNYYFDRCPREFTFHPSFIETIITFSCFFIFFIYLPFT